MKSKLFMFIAAALALFASPAFSASAAAETTTGSSNPAIASFETSTLGAMIDESLAQNTVAQLCLARATRDETIAYCQANLATSQAWLDTLKGWLGTWYGNTGYTGTLSEENAAQIEMLQNTPDDQIEGAILEAMLGFNSRAMSAPTNYLGAECSDGGSSHTRGGEDREGCGASRQLNPDLEAAASSMIDYLKASTATVEAYRCDWYGKDC